MNKASQLIQLAESQFSDLSESEKTLFRSSADGKEANYKTGIEEQDNLDQAELWDNSRLLRADRIVWLCTDDEALKLLTNKGLQVSGAKIEGELNLNFAILEIPLTFIKCVFEKPINLKQAKVKALNFQGSHVQSINADCIKVDGYVYLNKGFKSRGEVKFLGSTISGNLECDGGQFLNSSGIALNADRADIAGYVYLTNDFKAKGEVNFLNAMIGTTLKCDGGQFINPEGKTLVADGIEVKGFVSLSMFNGKPFLAEGEVRLVGAKIGDSIVCENSEFNNKNKKNNGVAFDASGVNVGGFVSFCENFISGNEVKFIDSQISSDLYLLSIRGNSQLKFYLRSANVNRIVLDQKFLSFENDQVPQLNLKYLVYRDIVIQAKKNGEWQSKTPDGKALLKLLRRPIEASQQAEIDFSLQPYEQMARVLRVNGYKRAAVQVLVGERKDLRCYGDLKFWARSWNWLLGFAIGYGYRPHKALIGVIVFIILGSCLFNLGYSEGLFSPSKSHPYGTENQIDVPIAGDYPTFNAVAYSLDTFIPIVDLNQKSYWLPNTNKGKKIELPFLGRKTQGSLLQCYLWIHISFGWILNSLWIASFTNLVRKD